MFLQIAIDELQSILKAYKDEGFEYVEFREVKHNRHLVDIIGVRFPEEDHLLTYDKLDEAPRSDPE